ncbi:phage tail protein [Desulfosarcina sp. OttesenSCG-928-G10]|nr:phage tail protein [Desulfosarcina sp. OttesenSCG-928-G10]
MGFHFKVQFSGMNENIDMRFQEVSGLEVKVETEDMREGGEYAFTYRLPKRLSPQNLVLKRGLLTSSALSTWVQDALENFTFKPLLATITLLNEAHQPLMNWQAHQAWPVGWSLGAFSAEDSKIVIETLQLAYTKLRFLPI